MPATVGGEQIKYQYGRPIPYWAEEVYCNVATVTLAQLNAGFTFLAAAPDITYEVVDFYLIPTGTFLTATDVRISDTSAGPIDVVTVAIANVTAGNVLQPGSAGATLGAGFGAQVTANKGLQLRKTGSAATGGTSILVMVSFKVNNV